MQTTIHRRRLWGGAAILSLGIAFAAVARAGDAPEVPPKSGTSETIKLFNGRNLDGWHGNEKLWSVKDGAIVAKNLQPVKVSTYLLTDRKFTDFRLLATVKLVRSEMHSGISLWGREAPEKGDPHTYAGHLVMFPSGWGLYDLYGRMGLPPSGEPAKKVGKQHDWNDLEILAQGNRLRLVVNGTQVLDWRDPEPDRIQEGPIGLQLHSNNEPQEIHFKNLVLTAFPEDKLITLR
ncbi:MAG: DUF1080 domain-containing protein [Pirellulales bacterium]